MRTDDGSIVQECLNGKPGAFGILVDKYKAGIYAYVYTELRNFHDAQDVTQEVFLQAYRGLRSLRRWESFSFWLYRIAHNLCKKWVRTQSRRPDSEFIEDQESETLEVSSLRSHRESQIKQSLQEVLDSLPDTYREVLMLHYFGGMSIKEIAKAIGASPGAIGMRLSRARAQMREEMVAMVNTTFEKRRLKATFTFRIMETIKRMKIHPMPRTLGFPWGLPLATGIILALLSLNPRMSIFGFIYMRPHFPVGVKVLKTEGIPVDIFEDSQIFALAGDQGGGELVPESSLMAAQGGADAPSKKADVPDSQPGAIVGRVTDTAYPDFHNLEGVVVTIKNDKLLAADGGERTLTTDSTGEYRFDNLPPGEYIATASKPGYEPYEFRVTIFPRATAFNDLRLFLKGTEIGPPETVDEIRKRRAKPKLRSPQEPEKPYPYREEEVVYQNKKADVKIAGTFTFPDSDGPFPAVILLSDYGPDDRNELMSIHVEDGIREFRQFLVLADYLTRRGIAVLRTDNRGVGGSTGDLFESTIDDLAHDALTGIEYLKSRKEVNTAQIGLIGYGVGSMVALAVADQSEDIAFMVLMAGVGLKGEDLHLLRTRLIGESYGLSDEDITKRIEIYKGIFPVLRQEENDEVTMQKIRDVIADVTVKLSQTKLNEEEIQAIRRSSGSEYFNMLNPYFRSFLAFDPRPALMRLECPVLAFNSEDNLGIPPKQNLNAIEEALKAGGNENYTIKELSGLNLLFQTVQPGVPPSEIEETISPVVLELIGDWVLQQTN
jgi:RNA polymerase sigma factor (sigma-70 family)